MKPTTYTPGPWRYEASTKTIRAVPANYWLASMDSWDGAVNHEANATRIVACVNACKGIQDPETAIPTAREALRVLIGAAIHCDPLFETRWEAEAKLARAALALLKGETE